MAWMTLHHPEPPRPRPRILACFLPYHGCPGRCIYCAQHLQTGAGWSHLDEAFQSLATRLESLRSHEQRDLGLAFFGGTFTAIPQDWQIRFLDLARQYRNQGVLTHVRCSTRPDRVSPKHLNWLKARGLDMVELGVQSFSANVLRDSGRGYCGKTARAACHMVNQSGLELCVQLMPGLPGASAHTWHDDVQQTLGVQPEAVRIYPCLVLAKTTLAEAFDRGQYRPWGLNRAVWTVGQALLCFWQAKVPVIRIGLAPEQSLISAIKAGPWHPALGQMARSSALRSYILKALSALPPPQDSGIQRRILVPRRFTGEFWGHRRELARAWHRSGFSRSQVYHWDRPYFYIECSATPSQAP